MQPTDDVEQWRCAASGRQLDGDHVATDVHRLDCSRGEQPACQLVNRTIANDLVNRAEALMPHAGEPTIGFEPGDSWPTAGFLDDVDGLTHGAGIITVKIMRT